MAEAKEGGELIVGHGPGLVHRFVNFAFQVSLEFTSLVKMRSFARGSEIVRISGEMARCFAIFPPPPLQLSNVPKTLLP